MLRVNRSRTGFGRIVEPALIIIGIIAAIMVVVLIGTGPAALMTVFLYVVAINFATPLSAGTLGVTPIVGIISLDQIGFVPSVTAALVGIVLAAVLRPLFRPVWENTIVEQIKPRQRWLEAAVDFICVVLVGLMVEQWFEGESLLQEILARIPNTTQGFFEPLLITVVYLTLYIGLRLAIWRSAGQALARFYAEANAQLLSMLAVAVPLVLVLASIGFAVPTFIALAVTIGAYAIISYTAWQRRYVMEQQLEQIAQLNQIGASVRETLEPSQVYEGIHAQLAALFPNSNCAVLLSDASGAWLQPIGSEVNEQGRQITLHPNHGYRPDDLVEWVVENGRLLELTQATMHYATQRGLTLPSSNPQFWLGVPLTTAQRTIGALVVEKLGDGAPVSRWRRELLRSLAGQASASIENSRLYSETLRLYNLTDERLARRLEQLQALLNSVRDGVLMLDRTGQIVLVNPTAADMLGDSAENLLQQSLNPATSARPLGFEPLELDKLLDSLESSPPGQPESTIFERNGSQPRTFVERTEVPVRDEGSGRLMGWLMMLRDVTEERERAEWRADLTRMIVHDLRNPITTLVSAVDQLERRLPEDEKPLVGDLVEAARHGCGSMLEMVDSLMDINRAEAGQFVIEQEAQRMSTLVTRVVEHMLPLATQQDVALSFQFPDDLPLVWGDEELIRRVLVNLLDNALKFTPEGHSVTGLLQVEPADEGEPGVRVIITDEGPGIPETERGLIFERFITFNRGGGQVRGTGLGLTFCKLAVEAHGGRIWVDDAPEGGSQFSFTLPGMPF